MSTDLGVQNAVLYQAGVTQHPDIYR